MDSQPTTKPGEQPTAYSYVRFSTVKQQLGDSLRRQVEAAEKYCAEKNLRLDPVSYRDLGVSAFKRKNIEAGALAAFIHAVKTGKVAAGSFLIIEQFDRMSRADVDIALSLLLELVRSGVKVVTLVDGQVWDREAIRDVTKLILAVVLMSRANNESAAKADRLSQVWGEKKKRAREGTARRIVTSECPRWLAVNQDKTGFVMLEDRVESIRKVFQMRVDGYGISSIATRANGEKWPVPGKPPVRQSGESLEDFAARSSAGTTWHTSTIGRLLKNRALLGEYQPHVNDPDYEKKRNPIGEPIKGYYPEAIDEETFLRAQAKADRSGRFPGRRDASLKNWLQGLLKCTCGQSFVRKNKDSRAQPEYARYYCTARGRGVSNCPGAGAKEIEIAVLTVVSHFAPMFFDGTARAEGLKSKLDILEAEVTTTKRARDNYMASIEVATSRSVVLDLSRRADEAAAKLDRLEREFSHSSAELAELSGDQEYVFAYIAQAVREINSLDARAKLRESLSRIIEKVVVHQTEGYIRVYLRGSNQVIAHPLRLDATIPGFLHNLAGSPSEQDMTGEDADLWGRLHVDEDWWQQTQEKLKQERARNSNPDLAGDFDKTPCN